MESRKKIIIALILIAIVAGTVMAQPVGYIWKNESSQTVSVSLDGTTYTLRPGEQRTIFAPPNANFVPRFPDSVKCERLGNAFLFTDKR